MLTLEAMFGVQTVYDLPVFLQKSVHLKLTLKWREIFLINFLLQFWALFQSFQVEVSSKISEHGPPMALTGKSTGLLDLQLLQD